MVTSKKNNLMRFMVLFLVSLDLFSCAQTKPVVRRSYSFYIERLPGNIPVGPDGKILPVKVDTVVTIYLETNTKLISWDTAWKKGKTYLISAVVVDHTPFEAGVAKETNQKIIIRTTKGNFLWQLYLSPLERVTPAPRKMNGDGVLIKGKCRGKPIIHETGKGIELVTIPSV